MFDLPRALYSAEAVKQLDLLVIEQGLPGYDLMRRAAEAAEKLIQVEWPNVRHVAIFCGAGNNGGDGYALAKRLHQKGIKVTVLAIDDAKPTTETAQLAYNDFKATSLSLAPIQSTTSCLAEESVDLIVDAMLGIGIRPPLKANVESIIQAINQSQKPVLAIDVPSGINANTGEVIGHAVIADVTLTYIGVKLGLCMGSALDHIGRLAYHDLQVPKDIFQQVKPLASRVVYPDVLKALPKQKMTQHKGLNGHVAVLGAGAIQHSGAVCLAGEAALRVGAGLVSAYVSPNSLSLMARAPAELMCHALDGFAQLEPHLEQLNALVIGPGLSKNDWAKALFAQIKNLSLPIVVDADALNLLADSPSQNQQWILTPHPKEAARLLSTTVAECEKDRRETVLKLQAKFGGIIVLKGASTLVTDATHSIHLIEGRVPALAVGGTGDVLAGMIGGLLAQGVSALNAAIVAVSAHREAGWLEQSFGRRGMLASELFPHIRTVLDSSNYPSSHPYE